MRRRRSVIAVFAVVVFLACGTPTQPCGTFSFSGTPTPRGENVSVTFNFNPATCGAACTCNTIAYIQVLRVINRDTGEFLAPNSDQRNRIVTGDSDATQNGWAVDRISDRQWGYYARFDTGSFDTYLTTGSNTSPAILGDGPGGFPDNTWMDFVSVPVCIDSGASCNNSLTGYWYWLFVIPPGGVTSPPFSEVGVTWMQDAFDKSVVEWNNDAPGLGKHPFPAMTRM